MKDFWPENGYKSHGANSWTYTNTEFDVCCFYINDEKKINKK